MSLETTIHVISERTLFTFDLPTRQLYTLSAEECIAFAQNIIASANTSASNFTRIVAMRSLVYEVETAERKKEEHEVAVWTHPGPISTVKFLEMMQFTRGISHDAWRTYMTAVVHVQPNLRKIPSQKDLLKVPGLPRVASNSRMRTGSQDTLAKMSSTDGKTLV